MPKDSNRSWLMESFDQALDDDQALLKDSELVREIQNLGARYELGESLGEGGQKHILVCKDSFTQRKLAMAVLKDSQKLSNNEAFINEARISAHLEHPNIVPLYDLGLDEDNKPYFTMKLLSGENLQKIIEGQSLSVNESLEIFLKVCDAMAYAHSQGIVHLDLKPENIQVDSFGQVLVCDWGLAQNLKELQASDQKSIRGSLAYMAPEQIRGEGIGIESDIYALGGILYALFIGEASYSSSDCKERMKAPELKPSKEMLEKLNQIPLGIKAVVLKAMESDTRNRYQTVSDLSKEIRAYIAGFATSAENPSSFTLIKKAVARHKTLSFVMLSSLVLISVLGSLSFVKINNEKEIAQQAQEIAEKSERKTRVLFGELKVEQETRQAISESSAKSFLQLAKDDYKKGKYQASLNAVKESLKLDPKIKGAWDLRGKLEFGYLRFSEAKKSLQKGSLSPKQEWLMELADKGLTKEGEVKPSAKQIYDVRREIVRGKLGFSGLHALMFYNMVKNYNIEERLMFAEQSYRDNHNFFAGRQDKANFTLQKKGKYYSIDASGNKGTSMTIVLFELPITSLNLSGAGVRQLEGLRGMPLRSLDISNTSVSSIGPLKDTKIKYLNLIDTSVFDLSPLRETQIEHLILGDRPLDIKVLKNCRSLKKLELPKNIYSEKLLEDLKLLDKVIYR